MACYAGALALVAAGLAVRYALNPLMGAHFPLLTVTIAIIVSARYLGAGPSIAGAFAGVLGQVLLFGDWRLGPSDESGGLIPYLVVSLAVIWVTEALRRARQRADERLAQLRAESARRELEQRFAAQLRAIVESSDDAIVSASLDGKVTSWNRAAVQIFGYTAGEAIGEPISMLTPAEHLREEAETIASIKSGVRVKPFETIRQRKDGSLIQVALTVSPIHNEDATLAGASYIARDITERKQFEERLTQSQKLESLGVLAGGLAHDFNNLLTGIMGNAGLALQMGATEAVRERIAEVLIASERAAVLIRQMLAYAGKGAFVVERFDLSQQLREIVPLVRPSIPRAVEIDLRLANGLPQIESDRSQIQQLAMNLIINAAEAIGSRAGQVTIVTALSVSGGTRRILFEVSDNGCGMDAATRDRIFEPFFTTKFQGRGLGLAAALGIVRAQKGEISVESAPGEGTVFRVLFPAPEDTAQQ